jgi:transcriptional regulator with XRE-family HTH domain
MVESLGQRIARGIRDQRRRSRLSQLKLAERAELSLEHVSRMERGLREPSLRALQKIATALGVDAAELFSGGGR